PGFPLAPFQVAYRYRPTVPEDNATLYQLGNGVFSANALPPYKNWDQFKPVIERGIRIRNEAFTRLSIEPPPFSSGIVRYIDAFQGPLLGERTTREFLADVLGFKLTVPSIVEKVCTDPRQLIPQLQLVLPVGPGQLQISLSDGQVKNQPAVIVDTSVIMNRPIATDPSSAVKELTEARNVIHDVFMQIALPLHDYMKPIEVAT
ncbi:MAG: TIGR04255 family protein, partial [Burkholderiales bacterium]